MGYRRLSVPYLLFWAERAVGLAKENRKKNILEWIAALVIVILIVGGIRIFVFSTVVVDGPSMEPTYEDGDFVLVNKMSYQIGEPKKDDIIIFTFQNGAEEEQLIKRVIGVPGDVIDLREEDGHYVLWVNDEKIAEPYLAEEMTNKGEMVYPYTVPTASYFVMGDNRNYSMDSRSREIGAVSKRNIVGKVIFTIWPFGK